ncbi:MAG: hypothetical protein KZQ62_09345 [Candidatus Thiodiazotropha sp. (ex Lucinoma aequizonata)]|nr:hypothetical protein [Candidatus Thiodiazotropha sp. (ex Lucinoma aequizonata)]
MHAKSNTVSLGNSKRVFDLVKDFGTSQSSKIPHEIEDTLALFNCLDLGH